MENTINNNQNAVFDLVMLAGKIMLENGAEIFRVEETMKIIANKYTGKELDVFVMANGIITSMEIEGEKARTGQILHIPISPVHLGRVAAVNKVSRDIAAGKYSVEEAIIEMKKTEDIPYHSGKIKIIFAGVGSGTFCYMLGGTIFDSLDAFIAGFIMFIFMILMQRANIPEMLRIVFGGAMVTIISIILYSAGIGDDFNHIIMGAIICLVPGVSFTMAIRNFFSGDYLSGTVRLVNAVLVSVSISVGVGIVMIIWQNLLK